jgi:hypothetical protein
VLSGEAHRRLGWTSPMARTRLDLKRAKRELLRAECAEQVRNQARLWEVSEALSPSVSMPVDRALEHMLETLLSRVAAVR